MGVSSSSTGGAQPAGAVPSHAASYVATTLDLLVTAGTIDGPMRPREQAFVRQYIDSVLLQVEQSAPPGERDTLRTAWQGYLDELHRGIEVEIAGDASDRSGSGRLHNRALLRFRSLTPQDQKTAIELLHALINADGHVSPAEYGLYQELTGYFAATPAAAEVVAAAPGAAGPGLTIAEPVNLELAAMSHPLLDPLEQTYSPHPVERKAQVDLDHQLIGSAIEQWGRQRAQGAGGLVGLDLAAQVPAGSQFLDGHVHVLQPAQPVELVVLGDLHGCYSCLKAALLQSNFIQRVWAHQWDPQRYPDVKLVLLGDYIDRGRFSFDGVLRAALMLLLSMPQHVFLLRGNHEYLRWVDGRIMSGVYPAEALASIAPHVPIEMLEAYRLLFEHMPTSLVCDSTLYVHGGIPRDDTFEARYRDLSSLNDPELRFQMMWSDPVHEPLVPVDQQRQNPRFSFGHQQFTAFMQRLGLHTMIRGHEQIDRGFDVFYDLGQHRLLTLFSAGGRDNCDLPSGSSYRNVTPMALTVRHAHGTRTAYPWPLLYQSFNYPPHNGLYRPHPLLQFRHA